MGCGLSKSSDSDSPKQKRKKGSKHNNSVAASDVTSDGHIKDDSAADSRKAKLRVSGNVTPVLNQTKALSSSQLEFFRELDEKIEKGKDLDPGEAERESQARMDLLLRHWDEVIRSRPATTRPRPNSLASTYSSSVCPLANGGTRISGSAPLPEDGEDSRTSDAPKLERNQRSSRRSMRSARNDSADRELSALSGGGPEVSSGQQRLDDSQLVSRLIQLGDAYVPDLDADDPDMFVRLGRRPSNFEEPIIPEEGEHGHGRYGQSSLALRTVLDDSAG